MESFGLFQFLKSMLSSPDQTVEKNASEQENPATENPPMADGIAPAPTAENYENAFVDFARAHDARARRTKH